MPSRSTPQQTMSAFRCITKRDRVMSNENTMNKSETNTEMANVGLKRRDLLLSSSLIAASALSSLGLPSPAQAQQQPAGPAPSPSGQRPNILVIMADDIGW